MKLRATFILAATLTTNAQAASFWSEDKATNGAIVAANVLLVVDWAQTRYGTDRPHRFEEIGFARRFVGAHPSNDEVNRYNVAALVLMNTAGYLLPEQASFFGMQWNPKKSFYFGMTAIEGHTVYGNYQAGVKLDF